MPVPLSQVTQQYSYGEASEPTWGNCRIIQASISSIALLHGYGEALESMSTGLHEDATPARTCG